MRMFPVKFLIILGFVLNLLEVRRRKDALKVFSVA